MCLRHCSVWLFQPNTPPNTVAQSDSETTCISKYNSHPPSDEGEPVQFSINYRQIGLVPGKIALARKRSHLIQDVIKIRGGNLVVHGKADPLRGEHGDPDTVLLER